MKLAWLTLPLFLLAGITCAHGSNLVPELESICSRSSVKMIGDSYKASAAVTAYLVAGIRTLSRTGPANLSRSMWGQ